VKVRFSIIHMAGIAISIFLVQQFVIQPWLSAKPASAIATTPILVPNSFSGAYSSGALNLPHQLPSPALHTLSATAPDPHPEAFMIHDRAGHISSSRVWKFDDDWYADGGKLGCRRFSTKGATVEFCLDPYNTGCSNRDSEPIDYKPKR
jgi:hypothetical protein